VLRHDLGEGRDEQAADARLQGARPHDPADVVVHGVEVRAGGVGGGKQDAGVLGEQPARIREPHAAAGLLEQRRAGLALQDGELLRHRRRRVAERLGHGGEGAALGQPLSSASRCRSQATMKQG